MNHSKNVKKTCVDIFNSDEKSTQANIQTLTENVNFVSQHNTSIKRQSSIISRSLQAAWADIQATCTENAGLTITEQISYVGYYSGTLRSDIDFAGASLAPDGKIFVIPASVNDLPIFDPTSQQFTSAGVPGSGASSGGAFKFSSAVYAPSNNAMYYFPYKYGKVLKYSLDNQLLIPMADLIGYWNYGTLATNNCIYAVSVIEQNQILKLNLATETFTYLTIPFGVFNSEGFSLAPNGKLYAAPGNGTYVLCLDPSTDQMTQFGSLPTGDRKWCRGVLGPNDYIYCMPYNSTKVLKINYVNHQASTVPNINVPRGSYASYNTAGLVPNGKIYAVPHSKTTFGIFDPVTETMQYGSNTIAQYSYNGFCIGFDGYVYVTPRDGERRIIKIDIGANVCRNFAPETLLSPLIN